MLEAGQLVVKIIQGGRSPKANVLNVATIQRVRAVKRGVAYLGEATEPDDVSAYDADSGRAKVDYIPGFTSFLVPFDADEEHKIREDQIP